MSRRSEVKQSKEGKNEEEKEGRNEGKSYTYNRVATSIGRETHD